MNMKTPLLVAGLAGAMASAAQALPPIEDNPRIMGELVSGEVSYQIHKHCPTLSMRRLRALARLNDLRTFAEGLGYSDADFRAVSKNKAARAKRDARVNAVLASNGVTKGDADSYCRLGYQEIEKNTLSGYLLRRK